MGEALVEAWPGAFRRSARDALNGTLSARELSDRVDEQALYTEARRLLEQPCVIFMTPICPLLACGVEGLMETGLRLRRIRHRLLQEQYALEAVK